MSVHIHKYTLDLSLQNQEVEMTERATIVAFQNQCERAVIWVLEDPEAPKTKRPLRLCVTGEAAPYPATRRYVGTAQFQGGQYVAHLFDMRMMGL